MIVILGAGMTGLSIAYHLKERGASFILVEKDPEPGGLCRSIRRDNYIFDYTGHFLHAKSPYVRRLAHKLVPGILTIKRKSFIFIKGRLIPYPFQANLNYLLFFDRLKSITGYFLRKRNVPKNLHEWILTNFGHGMAGLFFFPYNKKLWKYPLTKITPDFLSSFVPEVSLFRSEKDLGYNVKFLYPESGIGEFTSSFAKGINIFHGEIRKIDESYVSFDKGRIRYDRLVSTIPLPDFLRMLSLPQNTPLNTTSLKWNSVFCLNLVIARNLLFPNTSSVEDSSSSMNPPAGFHWIYFPEEHFPFYRVGSFSNISPLMVPEGHSSLWVEVSYRDKKPETKMIDKIINALSNIGLFNKNRVECVLPLDIPYAYPIYNKGRKKLLSSLEDYLNNYKITLAGRFGGWKYSYMEESILEGKRIAEELCGG